MWRVRDTDFPHSQAEHLLWEGGEELKESLLGFAGAHATTPIIGNYNKDNEAESEAMAVQQHGARPHLPQPGTSGFHSCVFGSTVGFLAETLAP